MADDEVALTAAGFEVLPLKVGVFVLGGSLAAIAGVVYASYLSVAQVSDYSIDISIMFLAAVTAGGLRSIPGSFFGALLFVGLPSALNLLHIPVSIAGPAQQLLFGLLLVAVMMFLPGGLAGAASSVRRSRILDRRGPSSGSRQEGST
jgi:branched-chain amino acid transport system permease protein